MLKQRVTQSGSVGHRHGLVSVLAVLSSVLVACEPAGGDGATQLAQDAPSGSCEAYAAAIDRSRVRDFIGLLAGGETELADTLQSVFDRSADPGTHPDRLGELPTLAEVCPFHLWSPVIEQMRELQLVSSFDPRAHDRFDPRIVRLRFLPEPATSRWRAPVEASDWVAGIIELDRQAQQTGMRLVALDDGSDSYLLAVVEASGHDRLVELGPIVGQRVRRINDIPF